MVPMGATGAQEELRVKVTERMAAAATAVMVAVVTVVAAVIMGREDAAGAAKEAEAETVPAEGMDWENLVEGVMVAVAMEEVARVAFRAKGVPTGREAATRPPKRTPVS